MPKVVTVAINGYALREIRARTGVTAGQLADEAGISRAYMTRIELGYSTHVSAAVFARLARALRVQDQRSLMSAPQPDTAAQADEGVA